MNISKHIWRITVIAIAAITLTSCYSVLWDFEVTPESQVVQVPQEGGQYYINALEWDIIGTTRVINPGETFKCYRYRLNLGNDVGDIIHSNEMSLVVDTPANESGAERNISVEVSKAINFHRSGNHLYGKICDEADLAEDNWEEWQTVWSGVQAGQ